MQYVIIEVSTLLLIIFPTLHISYSWLISFITGILYLLILLTFFFPLPINLPSGHHQFVLCVYKSVSVCYIWSLVLFFRTHLYVFYLIFFEEFPYCFPQWLHQFAFPITVPEGSKSLPPTLVICCLFDNCHSDRYEVVSHCGFDLHFPDD